MRFGGGRIGGIRKEVGKVDLHGRRISMFGDDRVITNFQSELMIPSITINY